MSEQIGVDAVELIGLCLDPLSELYAQGAEAKVIFDNARVCVEAILEQHVVVPAMQPDPDTDPLGIVLTTAERWQELHEAERLLTELRDLTPISSDALDPGTPVLVYKLVREHLDRGTA